MMKKYTVITDIFKDAESNHIYVKGNDFPFDDSVITDERLVSLSSKNNKIGKVLIKEKKFNDFSFEDLKEIATIENINIDIEETIETLRDKIIENNKSKTRVRKELAKKDIPFDETDTLIQLEEKLNNGN